MELGISWDIEEVKSLFKFVEIKKSEGIPLIKIFNEFAKCTGRIQNSVRNFYYQTLKDLKGSSSKCIKLGININNHAAKKIKLFTKKQTDELVAEVNKLVDIGYSVRGACLKLANGDATEMIRIQNKYRSQKREKGEKMGNIIKMPIKNAISDEDINALFMGLIKLVKRQEQDRAKVKVQLELENANHKLKQALKEIVIKKAQIDKLQSEIVLLKQGLNISKQKTIQNRVKMLQQAKAKDLIYEFVSKKDKQSIAKTT